jgi:serine protease Do
MMARQFAWITAGLSAVIGVLVGIIVTGTLAPVPAAPAPAPAAALARTEPVAIERSGRPAPASGPINFADVAERLNPAVVNIDATARGRRSRAPLDGQPRRPDIFQDPYDLRRPRSGDAPRRGMGTGFIIDAEGHILTNQHVIDGADRLTVKLTDGRSLRAEVVGSDPDTDIALIKVEPDRPLPHATLGDSDRLRVGEWVCAIGNPLAYEHTVTVGVVSFIGRKLFDSTLDNYIQTDAAISFGNSGGPLINSRGQVVGINSAVSRQSSNIGFAVPINQARAILPQLRTAGKVLRGFIGVTLRDVDQDLQASLRLSRSDGALVQDVTAGSPGARAGLRPYDLIVAVDGEPVKTNDGLIREIAQRNPGSVARLEFLRDGRSREVSVKLAERPARNPEVTLPTERSGQRIGPGELGLALVEIDGTNVHRFDVPPDTRGLLVQSVEPLSAAYEAGIERGQVILEVNRQPIETVVGFRRVVAAAPAGSILAVYLYDPDREERSIRTIRTESR